MVFFSKTATEVAFLTNRTEPFAKCEDIIIVADRLEVYAYREGEKTCLGKASLFMACPKSAVDGILSFIKHQKQIALDAEAKALEISENLKRVKGKTSEDKAVYIADVIVPRSMLAFFDRNDVLGSKRGHGRLFFLKSNVKVTCLKDGNLLLHRVKRVVSKTNSRVETIYSRGEKDYLFSMSNIIDGLPMEVIRITNGCGHHIFVTDVTGIDVNLLP